MPGRSPGQERRFGRRLWGGRFGFSFGGVLKNASRAGVMDELAAGHESLHHRDFAPRTNTVWYSM